MAASAEVEKMEDGKQKLLALKRKGNEFFVMKKNYNEAIKWYTKSLEVDVSAENKKEMDGERSKLFANRAECKLRVAKFAEALEDCNEALTLQPRYVKAAYRKAKCLDELGKTQEAVDTLRQSLKYQRKNETEKLLQILEAKLRAQDSSVSKEDAIKIARFSTYNSRRRMLQADLLSVQKDMEDITDAKEELEVCIDDDAALLMVGDVFLKTDDDEIEQFAEMKEQELQDQVEQIQGELNKVLEQTAELKEDLKEKFGDKINLEER